MGHAWVGNELIILLEELFRKHGLDIWNLIPGYLMGLFGENKILVLLRTLKAPWIIKNMCFKALFLIGQGAGVSLILQPLLSF